MKNNLFLNSIVINFTRCVKSRKLLFGIAGVFCSLVFSMLENRNVHNSVTFMYVYIIQGIPFYLCLIFCAIPFADCFCEDIETHSYRNQIVRHSMRGYVVSKIITIVVTAVLTMMTGMMLFIVLLKIRFPWVMPEDSAYDVILQYGIFRDLLAGKHYISFFALSSLPIGILSGCLSLLAAMLSLFIKNKLLVYAAPVMFYYLAVTVSHRIPVGLDPLNFYKVFMPIFSVWRSDICSFLWSLLIGIIIVFALGYGLYIKLERTVRNE